MKTHTGSLRKFMAVALADQRVGAISRSSPHLVQRVCDHVPTHCQVIIEYGSGDGVMTRALLTRLAYNGRLFAIEPNPEFVILLKDIADTRLIVLPHTAEAVMRDPSYFGISHAEIVVSSIPFSFLSARVRDELLLCTRSALIPGGRCIIFHQYLPLAKPILIKYFDLITTYYE